MIEKIIGRYALNHILENVGHGSAITDSRLKVLWNNSSFKDYLGEKRLKGRLLTSILNITISELQEVIDSGKIFYFRKDKSSYGISIIALTTGIKTDGYLVSILPGKKNNEQADQLTSSGLSFEQLQELFDNFRNAETTDHIYSFLLDQSIKLCNGDFGLVIISGNNTKPRIIFSEENDIIRSNPSTEKELLANFSFISKWLELNKQPMIALNQEMNTGYTLAQTLHSESLLVSPSFQKNDLISTIIVCRNRGTFNDKDIALIKNLSTLLSFAINSKRTEEINNALETRVLQSQKLETIGKLSSGMAHDFSNLLASIFGSVNLLRKRVPQQENVARLIDNIENCANRAKELTQGLLSFGKPTQKRKEQIKPNHLINEITKVINQTFPARIKYVADVQSGLHDLLGNPTEIYQVLLNLCVNAKEAIEKSGTLSLTADNLKIDEKNLINFPFLDKANYVRISVKDTGSGIKEEYLQKIFDPYFSTKSNTTGSGSGLGLYVTYGIIKAHKGHIDVTSEAGTGTTFTVYLPAFEPDEKVSGKEGDKIILLADDELMLRELLAELLEASGYNVIQVGNGLEALKVLIEEIQVDLAIIDYNMPEMNGLDCIKKIRELGFKMPLILSSGSLKFTDSFDAEKMGITEVLPKPYEMDTLLRIIKSLI